MGSVVTVYSLGSGVRGQEGRTPSLLVRGRYDSVKVQGKNHKFREIDWVSLNRRMSVSLETQVDSDRVNGSPSVDVGETPELPNLGTISEFTGVSDL